MVGINLQFSIDDKVVQYLMKKDAKLSWLISEIGDISVPMSDNYFEMLAHSIIGQQLSFQAAKTISNRIMNYCKELNPAVILAAPDDELRSCGLSKAKITYLKALADKVKENNWLYSLDASTDEQVMKALTTVKGIGPWTAQMFLIFALGRLDVFSFGDAGLKKAIKWLYQMDENPDLNVLTSITDNWIPYRTVASLYLWDAIDSGFIK